MGTPGLFNSPENEDFAVQMTTTGGCFNGQHGKQLEDLNNTVSWTVYPNPSNSSFTIELRLSANFLTNLHVFDITGKEILRLYEQKPLNKGLHTLKISNDQLPAGVYICQLKYKDETGQEQREYLKLVKTQ
ncbi:MAG: T9SS type A sorting domain-containing protein [Chitinophagales bacterium]